MGRREVFDTESVRRGNCSTFSGVVRLGFVGQLPCRKTSISDNFLHLLGPRLNLVRSGESGFRWDCKGILTWVLFFKATLQVFTLHSTLYSAKLAETFFARLFCAGTLQISNTKNKNTSAEWKLRSEDLQSSFKKQAPGLLYCSLTLFRIIIFLR